MGNIGDLEKDGNTSYDQENIHNSDNQQKHGITNMNYHNMPNYLINIGISTGMTNMWNETVGKKLNSSWDTCLKEGVMLRFIHFFPYLILSGLTGPLTIEAIDDEPRLPWQQQHQLKMRLDELM